MEKNGTSKYILIACFGKHFTLLRYFSHKTQGEFHKALIKKINIMCLPNI